MQIQKHRGVASRLTSALSLAWEDSDRVIGRVETREIVTDEGPERVRGLALRTYLYREGIGGTAPKGLREQMENEIGLLSSPLGFIPNETTGMIAIELDGKTVTFESLTTLQHMHITSRHTREPTPLLMRHGIHANGIDGKQDAAPVDVTMYELTC